MNPPTEQLIRDYLNRLSVAARGTLGHKDLQALLDQTRARIEVECGAVRDAGEEHVRQVLDDLGDPATLAETERARIAVRAMPAECEEADLASGASPADLAGAVSAAGTASAASGVRPALARTGLRLILPWTRPAAASGSFLDAPVPPPGPDTAGGTSPELYREGPPGGTEPEYEAGTIELPLDPGLLDESQSRAAVRLAAVSDAAADLLSRLVRRLAWIGRQYKPEAAAVVLLGVGGAMFPPLWLLGTAVAVPSRTWDVRDKWLGIVLPVLAVLVGTALIIVFGGQRGTLGSYLFEAWVWAGRLFRLLAAVSAGYLLWRLHLGRRKPKLPPWNIPRKLDF
ncbi:MAG TPA: hypothetical protein VF834_23630 [Streptosporangiaceae bacterium]